MLYRYGGVMKVRTEARRVAIVEIAAEVFLDLGYEGATMHEVSKRLGGSKTTLYGYFPTKEQLFTAVVEMYATSHLHNAVAFLSVPAGLTLEQQLIEFGRKMMAVLMSDSVAIKVYRLVLSESGRSDVGVLFHNAGPAQCIEALSELMARATAAGELKAANPKLRANQFLALLTAEPEGRLFQRNPVPMSIEEIETVVDDAVSMFMGGASSAI
ncbi:TetR family transcriptional regulator [Pseudomonas syringae pv. theae ICMP 3923]|uniref:TetR family transcriptional regulator n=4 Tax=Pseudomonas syringae group TaxID=136849 RepID=S6UST9_PSESF|nr:TetR family transcriptional regulator [Pseudomonas syringae pv. theae ICMP 3923]EPM78454.1 TetR family transcriptional regulator [Pseudomonas syringae pv. actinidiae ICMP 19072]EPM83112.1 TetR family transcriptional regulator [Pseudomonas syringae pv. actinidiae ICMP 18886]EPN06992.1 TetR family transcriptional regulator [Pseudomonas syringae pv. actinidiae ICMP 19102]EPN17741.1 TetR family transcriptional regulator [Pseudomonas syringae pv. actinidiae ICMP 19070]EPN57515.1 TetR family tran